MFVIRSNMSWPYTIPADLRPRLEDVLGQSNFGAAEIWGEVREWLEAHRVDMPEGIAGPPPVSGAQRDQ